MADNRGNRGQGRGADSAPGQQKQHTILNPETGEQRVVTQEEWRKQGKTLREQGFQRPDDEDETEEGEGEEEG